MRDMTYRCFEFGAWDGVFIHVSWRIYRCDMTHSYVLQVLRVWSMGWCLCLQLPLVCVCERLCMCVCVCVAKEGERVGEMGCGMVSLPPTAAGMCVREMVHVCVCVCV